MAGRCGHKRDWNVRGRHGVAGIAPPRPNVEMQRDARKLGRCRFVWCTKSCSRHWWLIADIAGPPTELQAVQDAQLACTQKKTLGTFGRHADRSCHLTSADEDDGTEEPLGDGGIWFRFRFNLGLDANQH